MQSIKWGIIEDGGTFEMLMHTILYAMDPNIVLFGRPGKDSGQDARLADGTIIYQAKYRQHLTMDAAIPLALGELHKIEKYREASHANYSHWKNAKQWVLFANLLSNPNDDDEWKAKVVPAFEKVGLKAEYWGLRKIEVMLAEYPHITEVFFEGENRVLVGLKEAHDRLRNECIGATSLEKPLVARDAELKIINDFVLASDKRVLPVIGVAGIGKSRLVYEALAQLADNGWRVFWALPESMSRSSRWFQLLNNNLQTCVAVDDSDDPQLIRTILEQLSTIERRNWKVIISSRSSSDFLLRLFQNQKFVSEPLEVVALKEPESADLLRLNLPGAPDAAFCHAVFKHSGGVPGWICLVAELASRGKLPELPNTVDGIAKLYVEDCINQVRENQREHCRVLLQYMALWGTFAFEIGHAEYSQVKYLLDKQFIESELKELLVALAKTGIVRNWGIGKRLYAVQPLIVREYILSSWLSETIPLFEVRENAWKIVVGLVDQKRIDEEKQREKSPSLEAGQQSYNFSHDGVEMDFSAARHLALISYSSVSWSIYDRIANICGRIAATEMVIQHQKQNPKLIEDLLGEKQRFAFSMQFHIHNGYDWPVRVIYTIRNWLVHDGHAIGDIRLFYSDRIEDGLRMSAGAVLHIENLCKFVGDSGGNPIRCCLTGADNPWKTGRDKNLLEVLERYHGETDRMLAGLVKWTVDSFVGQFVAFSERDKSSLV